MDTEWSLLQPLWLLLLPLPLIWLLWRRSHPLPWPSWFPAPVWRYPPLLAQPDKPLIPQRPAAAMADGLMGVALLLAILALSQPVRLAGQTVSQTQTRAADLILMVGTSVSMTLRDYQLDGEAVDRMTMARRLLLPFVRDYPGERMGLVVLGDPSALWLPYSHDKALLENAVSRLQTTLGGRLMNLGGALQLAISEFPGPAPGRDSVIVVVSDGSLRWGSQSPREMARAARQAGFVVYTIAMGSAADQVPTHNEPGGLLYSPVDLGLLDEIAQAGGGRLFHALDSTAFSEALETISAAHQHPVAADALPRQRSAYYPPLLAASLVLILLALLSTRRQG